MKALVWSGGASSPAASLEVRTAKVTIRARVISLLLEDHAARLTSKSLAHAAGAGQSWAVPRQVAEQIGQEYASARERGNFDIAGVRAGEACSLIHDIPQAGEIVQRIVAEAERLLPARLGGSG
jgi:hypothetical protein